MEIITHVLTSEQPALRLDEDRKANARKNIGATGNVSKGEPVQNGAVDVDSDNNVVIRFPEGTDVSNKADKVSGDTEGHLAGLDDEGNLTDSGHEVADFATAAQGALADTAYQMPVGGVPKSDLAQGVQDSLDLADTALQEHQDISGKADKVDQATAGDIATLDASGNLTDSGKTISEFVQTVSLNDGDPVGPDQNGNVNLTVTTEVDDHLDDESENPVQNKVVTEALGTKADKVSGANEGNFAVFDENGNLTDDGIDASDFATAAQGALADTAYQKPVGGVPKSDLAQGVQDSLDLADSAVQPADLTVYALKSEMSVEDGTGADADKVTIQLKEGTSTTVLKSHQDITGKADKVSGATEGHLASLDSNGNLSDSGIASSDVTTAIDNTHTHGNKDVLDATTASYTTEEKSKLDGIEDNAQVNIIEVVKVDNVPLTVTNKAVNIDLSGKADKVDNATNGNFAGLDANGNLTDSHSKASDFATAAQGAKADTAIQGVKINDTLLVKDGSNIVNAQIDSIVPPQNNGEWIWSDEKDASNSMGWRQIVRDYVGNIQRDDLTGEPILDEEGHPITDAEDAADAVELWLRYKGIEFAARRAYADETGENIHTAIHNRTTMAQVIEAIETALANYGGFKVVPLVNGYPDPSPDLPSEKFIYLTKDAQSQKTDPYTEWIWIAGTPDGHWDCIGETSIDLTGYWHGAITLAGSGNVVTDVSVDLNSGAVTVTKDKIVADGATKVEASNTNGNIKINGTETTVYAHPTKTAVAAAAVKVGYDGEGHVVLGNALTKADVGLDLVTNQTITVTNTSVSDGTNTFNKYVHPAPSASGTDTQVGPTQDTSGNSITMPYFTYDSLGHVTGNGTHTHTVPSANDGVLTVTVGTANAKTFSANQSSNESITIPVAQSASGQDPATEGLISATDKEKLDGIEAGAEVNVIEQINVNGTAQTVTNKTVDITVPAAANDGELSITVGSANAVTFTANQSGNSSVTVPLAAKDTSGATPVYSEGLMTAAQNEKLDGIEAGAEVNLIESISVNGTAVQPDANKNVDITVPTVNDGELSITVGSGNAVTFTANQSSNASVTVPLASKDTSGATPVYTEGLMTSAQNEKLDNIAAFSSIQVTSGSTTGQVDADSANETLNLVAGDNITITADDTTKTIEISASLGEELGFLSGSATVTGIVNNGDVLTDPLTGLVDSNNGRFIIATDTDDGHVYLYALKSIPDLVNGVDLFTISVNSNVSRTTANGFYGVAGLEIRHKDNGSSLITESTESYASQVGECSVDLTVTIKNSTGTETTIDGVKYYGYLIRYAGDSTASGDAINVVTRISVIEETVGIVEYNGSQSSLSAGNGISIDNDTINANLGDGLGLDANNNIEVKVGAGLKIDTTGGVATVAIDNVTEEVVEEVQKLGEDLDKKITTTFPYAQITTMSDFMTYGTQGENRMFGQLFSVPITSELRVDDTVICVNALQSAPSIDVVFGIFEYDFSANNGAGSTYWLADTGVVHVAAGDNAFPIKNLINDVTRPSIELKSSCLYYAVWAIHNSGASNGLMLASCPGYGASYNAIPRYTVKTSGASVQVNWAGDGCLRSSWFSGYNEDNSIPRLFMMVRNKSDIQPSGNDPFIDITDYELNDQYTINQIFGSTAPSAAGAVFQKVIPARAVNITKFEWADTKSTVTATSSSPMVMDNSFGTTLTLADGTLTTAQDGDYYVHTFTLTNALAMVAGTVYWLPAQYNTVTETGMSDGGDNKLVQYNTNVARRDLQMIVDMAQPSGSGEFKASQIGVYLKLYDDNNNSWVI